MSSDPAMLPSASPGFGPGRECTGDRRHAIAMAARDLIIEKGFEGLRTRDIAERVGINVATLHYHVPSKEALIGLVAETIRHQFAAQSRRHPPGDHSGRKELLFELADFRETLIESPALVVVFSELLDRARRSGTTTDPVTSMNAFWFTQMRDILQKGAADGSLRPDLDPVGGAHMITGALSDFWRRHASNLSAYDRLAAEIVRAVSNPDFTDKDTSP